jgi:hypothetical protein
MLSDNANSSGSKSSTDRDHFTSSTHMLVKVRLKTKPGEKSENFHPVVVACFRDGNRDTEYNRRFTEIVKLIESISKDWTLIITDTLRFTTAHLEGCDKATKEQLHDYGKAWLNEQKAAGGAFHGRKPEEMPKTIFWDELLGDPLYEAERKNLDKLIKIDKKFQNAVLESAQKYFNRQFHDSKQRESFNKQFEKFFDVNNENEKTNGQAEISRDYTPEIKAYLDYILQECSVFLAYAKKYDHDKNEPIRSSYLVESDVSEAIKYVLKLQRGVESGIHENSMLPRKIEIKTPTTEITKVGSIVRYDGRNVNYANPSHSREQLVAECKKECAKLVEPFTQQLITLLAELCRNNQDKSLSILSTALASFSAHVFSMQSEMRSYHIAEETRTEPQIKLSGRLSMLASNFHAIQVVYFDSSKNWQPENEEEFTNIAKIVKANFKSWTLIIRDKFHLPTSNRLQITDEARYQQLRHHAGRWIDSLKGGIFLGRSAQEMPKIIYWDDLLNDPLFESEKAKLEKCYEQDMHPLRSVINRSARNKLKEANQSLSPVNGSKEDNQEGQCLDLSSGSSKAQAYLEYNLQECAALIACAMQLDSEQKGEPINSCLIKSGENEILKVALKCQVHDKNPDSMVVLKILSKDPKAKLVTKKSSAKRIKSKAKISSDISSNQQTVYSEASTIPMRDIEVDATNSFKQVAEQFLDTFLRLAMSLNREECNQLLHNIVIQILIKFNESTLGKSISFMPKAPSSPITQSNQPQAVSYTR